MNPVVHFEMSCDDPERIATFYRSVFAWRPRELGEDMGKTSSRPAPTPMSIVGVGQYVAFVDTEGNRCSMPQAVAQS